MMRRLFLIGLLALAACEVRVDFPPASVPVAEAARSCILPDRIEGPVMETVRPDEVVADRPILFHMLAVTWMPETCKAGGDGQGDLACGSENRFGWTLHGLWPNSDGRPYPRYCRPATRVAEATIRAELCRTPSVDLVQHEWAAHGTCGWDTPEAYFRQSAALYDRLVRPDPTTLAPGERGLTAGRLRDAFAEANPGLPRDAVYVAVSSGNRLREVRICHDLEFKPRACPGGDLGTPDRVVLTVEPVKP
ncbi:MAG: ribonuclease [Brevundimonas sp.]|nr:MAG: ribonuclease [Brevundimonas sp.]